jgi:hypothetical protein
MLKVYLTDEKPESPTSKGKYVRKKKIVNPIEKFLKEILFDLLKFRKLPKVEENGDITKGPTQLLHRRVQIEEIFAPREEEISATPRSEEVEVSP